MLLSLLLFVFSGCCVLYASLVSASPIPSPVTNSSLAWDYFLFVQQSPGGVCYNRENCSYFHNVTNWTMHGMWATRNGTEGPNWCNKDAKFVLEDIEDLLPEMVSQWPSLETNFSDFWSHEWRKHGTCASEIDSMRSERGFFSTVLSLHQTKMDFSGILSSHGIFPSHTRNFTTADFNAAFHDALGVQPLLECVYSQASRQILSQVFVCLRKDFSIMSCPRYIFNSPHKCWDHENFRYIPNF